MGTKIDVLTKHLISANMEYKPEHIAECLTETTEEGQILRAVIAAMQDHTHQETQTLMAENSSLHSEIREFKLLVREYFQMRSKIEYTGLNANLEWFDRKKVIEKRILSELERFTAQDVAELPFGSEEDILP